MSLPDTARCDAFWARQDTDRPLLGSWVGSYEIPKFFPKGLAQLPEGKLEPDTIRFEAFRPDYERLFELHDQTGADVPWVAIPLMMVPWVEAIAGCPIHHHGGNVWAAPWLDTYERLDETDLQPDPAWLETLVEFTRWLVQLSDGRFPVGLTLMRGPADLLAALRGTEELIYDLYDHSEAVGRALEQLTEIWLQVARAQLAHIPKFADGHCFSIQHLWGRRPGGWFQDDAIAYWSPTFYEHYARVCEARLSRGMELTGIHLHSPALFTVDHLVEMPDLDVIEVNLDDVGPRIPEMIPRFRQVLEHKRLLVWGDFTTTDLRIMKEHLPARGLALQLIGETPEKVRALSREVETLWSR